MGFNFFGWREGEVLIGEFDTGIVIISHLSGD